MDVLPIIDRLIMEDDFAPPLPDSGLAVPQIPEPEPIPEVKESP